MEPTGGITFMRKSPSRECDPEGIRPIPAVIGRTASTRSMLPDPQGPEADRVGGDAVVADAPDVAPPGVRTLALDVQAAVDAAGAARRLEPLDARARAAVLLEGGVVPEDVERLAGLSQA